MAEKTHASTPSLTRADIPITPTRETSVISKTIDNTCLGADNMETKGINIPTDTDAHEHAGNRNGISITSVTTGAATNPSKEKASDQSNGPTSTTQVLRETASTSNTNSTGVGVTKPPTTTGNVCSSEPELGVKENIECKSDTGIAGESSNNSLINECDRTIISNVSTLIDPLEESTKEAFTSEGERNKSDPCNEAIGEKKESTQPFPPATTCRDDANKAQCATTTDSSSIEGSDKSATLGSSCKPPVPNFRVEGSGAGDCSVTAAVASLSTVSACISLHSSAGHCGSTGGSNSLDNGEQPGSSSGPVSIQSSEEMRLSLVSWYSEPDDPSRLIEGCCSALNTYRKDENGVDICSSSMGHEGLSSVATSSPVCKSESEEKENKTPEPCGNSDKINSGSGGGGTQDGINKGTFTKTELINPNSNVIPDKTNSGNVHCMAKSNQSESLNSQSPIHKNEASGAGAAGSHKTNSAGVTRSGADKSNRHTIATTQRAKSHVQVPERKQAQPCSSTSAGGHRSRCQQEGTGRSPNPECPRCSRRSKSGTNTPASGNQVARNRTPANRRVVQSSKSSTEIKKPIKSILKHDSRGSGSGSDKQSSMDSLGSSGDIGATPSHPLRGRMSNVLMTRSDSGTRARFNFNSTHPSGTPPSGPPEDKAVSKLKRIEKYATLRMRKNIKPRPLDLSDCNSPSSNANSSNNSSGGKVGVPGVPSELMSKSMSYLEKSSNRVHITSAQGHQFGESTSASSTLKRHGSLRAKKQTPSQWEPSGNRTSALRMQKMQEAKAKNCSGGNSSASANSGSGDSLHYLPHSANSTSASGGSSGMSSIHLMGTHSAGQHRMSATTAAKEKHMGAKIFTKLSSALGQTASSNQKRLKQERGVQTETSLVTLDLGRVSVSPIPIPDAGQESAEQIRNLERLCNRYRNQFMKVQSEYERSESRKVELQKQLEETQHESTEMIEFLQAEKSTLAESLTEVEVEAKKWKDEMEALKTDYQSRCSSLVRLSEQHKQEAMKSQALLHRMENQSTSAISQLSYQLSDGTQSIHQTKLRVTTLTESLLKTYKVPPELLNSSEANQAIKETDLSCSLLLPLITSLSAAFPIVPMETIKAKVHSSGSNATGTTSGTGSSNVPGSTITSPSASSNTGVEGAAVPMTDPGCGGPTSDKTSNPPLTESSSFQSLNQAILEREAAEKTGLDDIMTPFSLHYEGMSPDVDQLSLKKEIIELNAAIAKLLTVVRVIVIHCDRKVSSVASSILQCLKSIEDDKVGNMADLAQVQKSLEAWSEKGMSAGASSSTSHSSSPPRKTTVTPTTVVDSSPKYLVGNGHAHV